MKTRIGNGHLTSAVACCDSDASYRSSYEYLRKHCSDVTATQSESHIRYIWHDMLSRRPPTLRCRKAAYLQYQAMRTSLFNQSLKITDEKQSVNRTYKRGFKMHGVPCSSSILILRAAGRCTPDTPHIYSPHLHTCILSFVPVMLILPTIKIVLPRKIVAPPNICAIR
jgi:hypothetical protein